MNKNSLLAYKNLTPELTKRQAEVFEIFQNGGEYTDQEVAQKLGWPINRVSGRVGDLIKLNKIVVAGRKQQNGSTCRVCRITQYTLF